MSAGTARTSSYAVRWARLDEMPRLQALEAEHGAEFSEVGAGPAAECVAHIPSVRLEPGPQGVRSVTVHGDSWAEVLDSLDDIIPDPGG